MKFTIYFFFEIYQFADYKVNECRKVYERKQNKNIETFSYILFVFDYFFFK